MSWHEVDMAADPRGGQFAYFQQMVDPFAGVTAAVVVLALTTLGVNGVCLYDGSWSARGVGVDIL